MRMRARLVLSALLGPTAHAAEARTICTVLADAGSGAVVMEQGDCRTRVTPASTFKIALALAGTRPAPASGRVTRS